MEGGWISRATLPTSPKPSVNLQVTAPLFFSFLQVSAHRLAQIIKAACLCLVSIVVSNKKTRTKLLWSFSEGAFIDSRQARQQEPVD